jgi:hypothetical protein
MRDESVKVVDSFEKYDNVLGFLAIYDVYREGKGPVKFLFLPDSEFPEFTKFNPLTRLYYAT